MTATILAALRALHSRDPIFVERKRDFLNLFTESDAVAASMAGQVTEYEIKVSRADFGRDRFKRRNRIYSGELPGVLPNRFYYATAADIITDGDVPSWAGWMEFDHERQEFVVRKKAPRLHRECHGVVVLMRLARAMRRR